MTSRDVIVALRRTRSRRGVGFLSVRAADLFWALLWFLYLVVALTGCSMDRSGLSSSLRGRIEVDAEVSPDIGNGGTDAGPATTPDVASEETGGTVSTDGGSAADVSPTQVGIVPLDGSADNLPPSACPFDPTRSLSPCNSSTALCRTYDTPGHAVYQENCTAEGYVCVVKCPT